MSNPCSQDFDTGLDQRLGELLVARGKLRKADLTRVMQVQAQQYPNQCLTRLLVKLGVVGEHDLASVIAELLGIPLADKTQFPGVSVVNGELSKRFLRENLVVPLAQDENRLVLAMADPQDKEVLHAVTLACGKPVEVAVGVPSEIETAIERLYGDGTSRMGEILEEVLDDARDVEDVDQLKDLASEAPVIRLVNLIIQRAADAQASDIHIEPFEGRLTVRYRIDGMLREVESPPAHFAAALISRVKLMAKLNIAERRLPQDGRIRLRVQGKDFDMRISTVPTMYGESVVIRLLEQGSGIAGFEGLGFMADTRKRFEAALRLPHGMLLLTGPTGSGKTTTLYTALGRLNTPQRKIITVEDPVEYQLDGINQIQAKPSIGLTFASALRSIVRQDPDVIMVGEMRDLETARICVQSSLTGHLVLSTLHTNDAAGSITRLLEMGIEEYLLTSTLNAIMAQRLVRVLCLRCRQPYEPLAEFVEELQLRRHAPQGTITLHKAIGCEHCNGTGFRGRTGIHELMVMDDRIRELVLRHADASQIHRQAIAGGMRTMYHDGLLKALSGITTIEEVVRVTQDN
jgi:general secretion pathway protein E